MARPKKETNEIKNKSPRKSIREIMSNIIDEEALKRQKEKQNKKQQNEIKEIVEKPKQWFQLPLIEDNFSIFLFQDKFYLHYSEWSDDVFAGKYNSIEECQELIQHYLTNSRKTNILEKNSHPNLHSVININILKHGQKL